MKDDPQEGEVWTYNKNTSNYGKKGDRYRVLHAAQMKVVNTWIPATVYSPLEDSSKVLCRETDMFKRNFKREERKPEGSPFSEYMS